MKNTLISETVEAKATKFGDNMTYYSKQTKFITESGHALF